MDFHKHLEMREAFIFTDKPKFYAAGESMNVRGWVAVIDRLTANTDWNLI